MELLQALKKKVVRVIGLIDLPIIDLEHTPTMAERAYELLSGVPSDMWITQTFSHQGKCCAVGHYMRLTSTNPNDYSLANCADRIWLGGRTERCDLRVASRAFCDREIDYGVNVDIALVNNGKWGKYQQETPKERTLALISDMIKAGY